MSSPIEITTRMRREQVLNLMVSEDDPITVRVRIDKDAYLDAYAQGYASQGVDQYDALHDTAFDFGTPYDCSDEIVAVDGDFFVVDYTTYLPEDD